MRDFKQLQSPIKPLGLRNLQVQHGFSNLNSWKITGVEYLNCFKTKSSELCDE